MSEAAMTMITVMTAGRGRHHCIRRIVVCGHFSNSPHTGQSGPHDSHGIMSVRSAVCRPRWFRLRLLQESHRKVVREFSLVGVLQLRFCFSYRTSDHCFGKNHERFVQFVKHVLAQLSLNLLQAFLLLLVRGK